MAHLLTVGDTVYADGILPMRLAAWVRIPEKKLGTEAPWFHVQVRSLDGSPTTPWIDNTI